MSGDLHQSRAVRDPEDDLTEPPRIRQFRRLVSLLMVVMMVGILAIAGALVWRIGALDRTSASLGGIADIRIAVDGEVIAASRHGQRLILVIEGGNAGERRIEDRDADTGALLQTYRLVLE